MTTIAFAIDGDGSPAETLGDLALLSCAQQVHAISHHSRGDDGVRTIEGETMALFEWRFGAPLSGVTGHSQ